MDNDSLWQAYVTQPSAELREKLILNYLPLVRTIAGRLAVKMPYFMQQADLESCGTMGLIEAVDKFDLSMGVAFETFAYHRIRGAMFDELRRQNWVPRTIWQRQQAVKAAKEKLAQSGEPVTELAVANGAGLTLEELRQVTGQWNASQMYSLDEEIHNGEGDAVRRTDLLADDDSPDPLTIIDELEDKRILADAIATLKERDRLVLALYYQEELTLKEIGSVLEVSESRVCQLHSRAVKNLRKILQQMMK
ncbi:FliA/WhiG family RNA polymerase sigma factor [Peptococcaceae bacterium 1198_IL3148]